jgi:hypothetical protein
MKKLIFFRSYQGSLTFTKGNSLFLFSPEQELKIPINIELGFSAAIDPDSGMSASLPLMNQLAEQAKDLVQKKQFVGLLDAYEFLQSFFQSADKSFSVLRLKIEPYQLSYEENRWLFGYQAGKVFQLKTISEKAFQSKSVWNFAFSTKLELTDFLSQELQSFQNQLKKESLCQDPFLLHQKLESVKLYLPESQMEISLEKNSAK